MEIKNMKFKLGLFEQQFSLIIMSHHLSGNCFIKIWDVAICYTVGNFSMTIYICQPDFMFDNKSCFSKKLLIDGQRIEAHVYTTSQFTISR